MKNISFAMTTRQVRRREKTVTRRMGWVDLPVDTILQPVVKGMGLRKGQRVEKIGGPIRVLSVRREFLDRMEADRAYGLREVALEGFPEMSPEAFVSFFADSHRCARDAWVTRIEFEYVDVPVSVNARLTKREGSQVDGSA